MVQLPSGNRSLRIWRECRVRDRAAQQIESFLERAIVLLDLRHIRLRARLFGALGLHVAAQRRLALGIGVCAFRSAGISWSTLMSGRIPFAWIERPDGVKYRAVVNRNAPLPCPSGMMVCTEPLPSARARLQDHKRATPR